MDEYHEPLLKVTYLNKFTGEIRTDPTLISEYALTLGNYSCDCNRRILFEGFEREQQCVSEKYIVYNIESDHPYYKNPLILQQIGNDANDFYND